MEDRKCDVDRIREYPDCFEDCPYDKCQGTGKKDETEWCPQHGYPLGKGISETAFATQVEDLLIRFQWKWMHIKPAMTGKGAWVSRTNDEGIGWLNYILILG
ncbi:hypothetical protein LCGC14_2212550, partial [marine sediment metagenome]